MIAVSLKTRLMQTLSAVAYVVWYQVYFPLVIVVSYGIATFVVWSLNFGLVQYILFEAPKLSFADKAAFFHSGTWTALTTYNRAQTVGIQIFSVLFAVNTALLIYVLRRTNIKKIPKKGPGASLFFAMLSSGCVACGTSILAPVLITLGLTSAPLVHDLSTIFSSIGSILLFYSIYKLAAIVNQLKVTSKNR